MDRSPLPTVDDATRRRLRARFGQPVDAWFETLPHVLSGLRERWRIALGSIVPEGTMSVVLRCRTAEGQRAVLKVSPDRDRLANEAAALSTWATAHVPTVLAVDPTVGALLTEAVEPGTTLLASSDYPGIDTVADLVRSLHETGAANASFPPLKRRVAYLFESWARRRRFDVELVELVSPDLYERSQRFATRLAERPSRTVLLHGDLTPVNILDGGQRRGLVAIDPAPCLGDPAFDAIDLLVWQAGDVATIAARASSLAPAIEVDAAELLEWCTAFAAMFALDVATSSEPSADRIRALLRLAAEAPPG